MKLLNLVAILLVGIFLVKNTEQGLIDFVEKIISGDKDSKVGRKLELNLEIDEQCKKTKWCGKSENRCAEPEVDYKHCCLFCKSDLELSENGTNSSDTEFITKIKAKGSFNFNQPELKNLINKVINALNNSTNDDSQKVMKTCGVNNITLVDDCNNNSTASQKTGSVLGLVAN